MFRSVRSQCVLTRNSYGYSFLGIYWSCYAIDDTSPNLFPGKNQYDRFYKILGRSVTHDSVLEERRGIAAENLGTHSMRKGAAT
jgi:hypothetical protein